MKSSHTRQPLHQQTPERSEQPFFSKAQDDAKKKDDAFFQTKLAVGNKDDKHEKEADNVANKVQKKAEDEKDKPAVQKKEEEKKEPGIQKMDKKEEEKPVQKMATPDKKEDDKKVQKKEEEKKEPGIQKMDKKEEEKPVQKMAAPDKKEDDKKVQKKEEEKKEPGIQKMDKKEEEKPVQKMAAPDKKEDDKKAQKKESGGAKDKDEPVMFSKAAGAGAHGGHRSSVEDRIKQNKGKGQSLPDDVRKSLENQLGADFSQVVIHTDPESIALNKELNSLAFTNGRDIFFNAGQYQPNSVGGQKLLAHELTHVIQQGAASKKAPEKKK